MSPTPFQLPLPSRPWLFLQHSLAPSGSRTLKSWVLGDPTPGPENPRVQQWDGGGFQHSLSLEASDSFWTWIRYRRNPFPACPHQTPPEPVSSHPELHALAHLSMGDYLQGPLTLSSRELPTAERVLLSVCTQSCHGACTQELLSECGKNE